MPARNFALVRRVAIKQRIHDALALCVGEKFALIAEQAALRDDEHHFHAAADRVHRLQFALARTHLFHDSAGIFGRDIDGQLLERLALFAVDCLIEHLGRADLEFIPFTAHVFNQN